MDLFNFLLIMLPMFIQVKVNGQKLRFVNVVFRHGDRTPLSDEGETFPTSPYLNSKFYPYGPSQLTNEGKQREYDLGVHIRQQYGEFLGDLYNPDIIIARSTDTDRTKMSLQLVMAGLFPPVHDQKWNEDLNWQPVVTNYVPTPDPVLWPFDCPHFLEQLHIVEQSPDVQQEISKHSELLKNLTKWTEKPIATAKDFEDLEGYLMSLYYMGLELPEWTDGIFPHGELEDLVILSYQINSWNQRLKTLNGGTILKNFTENMMAKINGDESQNLKMVLLSGHDVNIAAFLITLGVFQPHHPEFSSAIFVELLEKDGEYFVSIFYYLGIPSQRIRINIPKCEEFCPLKKFVELLSQFMPTEEDMIC